MRHGDDRTTARLAVGGRNLAVECVERARIEHMRIVGPLPKPGGNAAMSAQAAHDVESKGIYAVRPIGIQSDRVLQRFDTGGV